MGLRFYRTPEEIDADNAAAAKLERAAARHRSAIRRSPIVRGGRDPTLGSDSTAFERQRAESTVQRVRERVQAFNDSREADAQIEVLEHELAVLRRERNRAVASRVNRRRAGDENRRILQEQIQRMTAHEFLRWQPPRGDSPSTLPSEGSPFSSTSSVNLPPPSRESGLRFEVGANSPARPASPRPDGFIPSPPSSAGQLGGRRPVDGPVEPWNSNPPLTQGFAPARAARQAAEAAPTEATAEVLRITDENSRPGLETPPPETWEGTYPPLRRVAHMSPQPLPRNTVDGLGDRRTSPTPSEAHEEETWNHLLATMHERQRANGAVSQTSSFIAPTVVLDTNGTEMEDEGQLQDQQEAESQQQRPSLSQASSISFGEIGVSADDTCDPPPGITAEQVRLIRERHRRTAGSVRPSSRASRDRPRRITERHWPTDTPADRAWAAVRRLRSIQHSDPAREREHRRREREMMLDAILLSAETTDDIPDEWWALAGVARMPRSENEL